MSLSVVVKLARGAFRLDAAFESDGRLIALFGESGSGKTTLVNLIGGLVRPDSGRIVVDGRVLVDTDAGIFLPPHRRRVGYVFQDARLFPHLTVSQNLRYGRFFAPAGERYADLSTVIATLGIGHLLDRRPAGLSGGEKSRVAIGRALLASPRLLLMDEPLASLDAARRAEILPYVERLRDEIRIPIVYVSHAVGEVSRLADDVVLVAGGRVSACGPAASVLGDPDLMDRSDRDEAGALIEMEVTDANAKDGLALLRSRAGTWSLPADGRGAGDRLRARIRARDVLLATERPRAISALNIFEGRVTELALRDADALVTLDCGGDRILARITRRSLADLGLDIGTTAFAIVKAVAIDQGQTANAPRVLREE